MDDVIQQLVKEMVEKVVEEEKREEEQELDDLLKQMVQTVEEEEAKENEGIVQVGGATLKEVRKRVIRARGAFTNIVTTIELNLTIPRRITSDPNGPEIFADAIIDLVKKHAPYGSSRTRTSVGVTFESEEITQSVGIPFKKMDMLRGGDIVRNMEQMSQSNRSPLELDVPQILTRITYITPPVGSGNPPVFRQKKTRGRKRRFDTGKFLELIAFEKEKRAKRARKEEDDMGAADFLDGEAGEGSEEEEETEDEDSSGEGADRRRKGETNIMKNNVTYDCLPHALHQAFAYYQMKTNPTPANKMRYNASRWKNSENTERFKKVFEEVRKMKEEAGVTKSEEFGWLDIDQFQKTVFVGGFQILVFEQYSTTPFYKGPFVAEKQQLVLYLADGHYSGVRNVCKLLETKYYCGLCDSRYRDVASHYACRLIHRSCGQKHCPEAEDDKPKKCADCSLTFRSQICFENHIKKGPMGGKSRCQHTKFCKKCEEPYYTNKNSRPHECGEKFCHRCQRLKPDIHHCEMQPSVKNEKKLTHRRVFFDIESRADEETGQQIPVLFVGFRCCPECANTIPKDVAVAQEEICEKCAPDGRLKIIDCVNSENNFTDVADEMTKWLFGDHHRGCVLVAHNASGYDGQFILENMIASNKSAPEICLDGTKLIFMKHRKVRLVDSLKFLTMSLSSVGKSFEVDSVKGDFPILFIKPENFDYDGPLPNDEFYALDNKPVAIKNKLIDFLEKERTTKKNFNFYEELLKYCYNDVYILATAMTSFEKAFDIVNNVCLLEESVTMPSASATSYRRNHLDPEKPLVLDAKPSAAIKCSIVSQKHLAWIGHKENVQINISTTYGEEKIGGHSVDGFIPPCEKYPDGQIIEFFGCYWHAHSCKYGEDSMIGEKSAKEIREKDQKKIEELEKHHPVRIVWECDSEEKLTTDKEMAEFFEGYEARDILECERALVGGRTEVFRLQAETVGKSHHYVDVVSLYPTVMKHEKFPIGPPEDVNRKDIVTPILKASDLKFRGFLKCKLLAPQDLLLPLIPDKSTGKLVFALCKKCAKEENQEECNHSEDERAFTGVYTTAELKKALDLGYKILEVYHGVKYQSWAYNDKDGKGGLFTSYINQMMEEKIYSSGWPSNVNTDAEKAAFVQGYKEKEHIELSDYSRFVKNPGKRAVAKLMLNSLWGKFAQRVDRENTEIIVNPAKFYKLLFDKSVVLMDVRPVNDVLIVKHRKQAEELSSLRTSAVHIAAFVTSYARLRLYRFMEMVGAENIVYTDTDSIIYSVPIGRPNPLAKEIGPYLGQLTNELEGKMTDFITLGPKTYCYKDELPNGEEKIVRKAKGLTLNSAADKLVTFEKMKLMVGEVLDSVAVRTVQQIPQHTMRRDRDHRVYSKNIYKQFKYTFNKRRVLPDGSTLPFGYSK